MKGVTDWSDKELKISYFFSFLDAKQNDSHTREVWTWSNTFRGFQLTMEHIAHQCRILPYMVRNWTQQFQIRIALHFFWILDGSRSFSRKLERIWNGSVHSGEKSVQFQFKETNFSLVNFFPKISFVWNRIPLSDVFAMLRIQIWSFSVFPAEKGSFGKVSQFFMWKIK